MMKCKGTKRQHAELDAEYKRWADSFPAFFFQAKIDVMRLWRKEKEYLSKSGQRYPKIINIQVPSALEDW